MLFASRASKLHVQNSGHRSIPRTFLTLLPLLLTGLMLHAQQTPQTEPTHPDQQETTTIKKDVNVVNVLATVRNKQGQIVNNLTKDDFKLADDGRPQTIKYFSKVTDMPLTLGLLVDTSLSQRRVLEQERTASYTFLEDLLREWKDKAFVLHFDSEVELLQDLTNKRPKLEAALQKLEVPDPRQVQGGGQPQQHGGGTLLNDAVYLASDEVMSKVQGRKALIVLSDGVDQGSKVSLTRAIEAAQRSDTLVYTILFADPQAYNNMAGGNPGGHHGGGFPGGGSIGFPGGGYPGGGRQGGGNPGGGYPGGGNPGGGNPGGGGPQGGRGGGRSQGHADGKQVMERLAQQTGGRFYEVSKKETIEQIYTSIGEELRNQYSLGFTPDLADAEGGYHKILVTTTPKDLTVQARDGYYSGK
jgi:Mg-chelatase subunit ChlD